jgi:TRAF3-interacting protein 1
MSLESLMEDVKLQLGAVITKPKLNEKLLSKPPFRFLHDIVTSITTTTGFAEGLYDESELDSAAITDRQAKINYLEKIFNLVGICKVLPTYIDFYPIDLLASLTLLGTTNRY